MFEWFLREIPNEILCPISIWLLDTKDFFVSDWHFWGNDSEYSQVRASHFLENDSQNSFDHDWHRINTALKNQRY